MSSWDGRPERPERTAPHWFRAPQGHDVIVWWYAEEPRSWWDRPVASLGWRYLGPCLTPAEAAAAVAAERERIAAEVDCGCAARPDVLARLATDGEKRASYLCTHGDVCCALQAAAIRARGATDALAEVRKQARREGIEAAAEVIANHSQRVEYETLGCGDRVTVFRMLTVDEQVAAILALIEEPSNVAE